MAARSRILAKDSFVLFKVFLFIFFTTTNINHVRKKVSTSLLAKDAILW